MKTIIDAVNELKGEYFDGERGDEAHLDQVVFARSDFGIYRFGDIKIGSGNLYHDIYWKIICSRDQFNQCVSEMTGDKAKLKAWLDSKNKPVDVWERAPKDATHYCGEADMFYDFRCKSDGYMYGANVKESCSDLFLFGGSLIKKPKAKPIYTKAMQDAGELPRVGMECQSSIGIVSPLLPFDLHGNTVILDKGFYVTVNKSELPPVDTRTTSEKAVDQMIYAYNKSNNMIDVISEIKKGYITGVSFKGED